MPRLIWESNLKRPRNPQTPNDVIVHTHVVEVGDYVGTGKLCKWQSQITHVYSRAVGFSIVRLKRRVPSGSPGDRSVNK